MSKDIQKENNQKLVAIVTDVRWGFGRHVVNGVIRYIEEHGNNLRFVFINELYESFLGVLGQVDAFMLSGNYGWVLPYISNQPVIYLNRLPDRAGVPFLGVDEEAAGRLAAEMLWERHPLGFGFCTYEGKETPQHPLVRKGRLDGFVNGLKKLGLKKARSHVQFHQLSTFKELLQWVDTLPRPAGIFAFNDCAAMEVLQACFHLRLQVPEEVSVVGVDNDEIVCNLSHPTISTIDNNLSEISYCALGQIEKLLKKEGIVEEQVAAPAVKSIHRESTGYFSIPKDHRLEKAMRYIHEHAQDNPDIAKIVHASGLNQRTLEILFKEQVGRTMKQELISARHHYCMKALRDGRVSVEEISQSMGISKSCFYDNFKKLEGCTPTEYQRFFNGGSAPVRVLNFKNPEIKQIGILFNSFEWQSVRDCIAGASVYAQADHNIRLTILSYERFTSLEQYYWFDGIIATATDELPEKLTDETPVVFLSLKQDQGLIGNVGIDEEDIGRLVARHFLRKGHYNFAYLTYFDTRKHPPMKSRLGLSDHRNIGRQSGLRMALDESGLGETPIHFHTLDGSGPLDEWLLELPKPVALFCFNDTLAIKAETLCHKLGLRVPQDVAVMGVDDNPILCRLAQPSLSSVDVGFARLGASCLKQLVACLRKERPLEECAFPAQMVKARNSTAGLAVDDIALTRAVNYIDEHFNKSINVGEITEASGISRRPLENRFKKYLRCTPNQYLLETRLLKAEELLIYSSLSISDISQQCGFVQANYFCRKFRENYGMTPRTFRLQRSAHSEYDKEVNLLHN